MTEKKPSTARPYCLNRSACAAKTPGKHCVSCSAKSPERCANIAAALARALEDPAKLARKQAAARRTAANPVVTAKKRAAMLATFEDPIVKARHRAACKRAAARRMQNPSYAARLREIGNTVGRRNLAAANTPEKIAERSARLAQRHADWCPPQYLELNSHLRKAGKAIAERQQIIKARQADDQLHSLSHDRAAAYVRRIAPILRCTEDGALNPAGSHWRYGPQVLDHVGLIRLAIRKGAKLEALAA